MSCRCQAAQASSCKIRSTVPGQRRGDKYGRSWPSSYRLTVTAPRIRAFVRPPSAPLGETVAGCCRSVCDIRPRDQPPQHWREIWRLVERMSTEDFRAFFIQGAEGLMHLRCGSPPLAYSLADEQQILGIDVACLYEATRLLGTPAGVRPVHQSALLAHTFAQVSPRTGQALPKVVGSDLQHLSSNGVAYLEDRTEDKGQALFTIKAKKHPQGAGEHLLVHEQVSLRRCGLEIGQLQIWRIVERRAVGSKVDGGMLHLHLPALHIEHVVHYDAVKPRAEAAPALKRREPGEYFDEDLLRGVLSILRMVQHANGDVVDPRLMPLDQVFERLVISRAGAQNKALVLVVGGVIC